MTETQAVTWLTQDAYDRLSAELKDLKDNGRSEIAHKIDEARQEGDLKENGGYHAAREEQGKLEARIRQLEDVLRNATVGEAPADDGVVEPGMYVTAVVGGDEMSFLLGSREVAEDAGITVYSERSPLGEAIHGRSKGETTSYEAPNGAEIEVRILDAEPYDPKRHTGA